MNKLKLSRELRLAYLVHLLHKRLQSGKGSLNLMQRHYKLVIELEREKTQSFLAKFNRRVA